MRYAVQTAYPLGWVVDYAYNAIETDEPSPCPPGLGGYRLIKMVIYE